MKYLSRTGLSCCIASALVGMLLTLNLSAGDSLVTVRVGEQDTCSMTGKTVVNSTPRGVQAEIKFDLSTLPKNTKVQRAMLRLWQPVDINTPFGMDRWNAANFDGFKVWQVEGSAEPLATVYPFSGTSVACHEWDVTTAVQSWISNPSGNLGLKTNFPLPMNSSEPAWQRPFLELTYVGENTKRPPQPSELKAFYRSGQVFLTWKKNPHEGAFFDSTYRIYRSSEPITAANFDRVELAGEVHRLSQVNYRRTMYNRTTLAPYAEYVNLQEFFSVEKTKEMSGEQHAALILAKIPHHYNFVIDDTWAQKVEGGKWLTEFQALGQGFRMEKGPELSDEMGLFVNTVSKEGKSYFAVTSVLEGNENRQDFSAANVLSDGLDVKVETPKPILQVVFNTNVKGRNATQIREYVYWGGGPDGLHNCPSTPFYFRCIAPMEYFNPAAKGHSWVNVGPRLGGYCGAGMDGNYLPPTPYTPFPQLRVQFSIGIGYKTLFDLYYGSKKPVENQSFGNAGTLRTFYGYHDRMNLGQDPRKATVQPYLERRALRELEYFFQEFPTASREQVIPCGESMSLMFGLHNPEIVAQIAAAQEQMWTSKVQDYQWTLVGKREWALQNDQKENVWNWMDPVWYSRRFPTKAWPFISHCQSVNYDGSGRHWGDSGYPDFYLTMNAEKRGGHWWWCDIGDAPQGRGIGLPRNQAYLAFTNTNFCETAPPPDNWRSEPRGTLNGYLIWHHPDSPFQMPKGEKGKPSPQLVLPLDLIDTTEKFEVAVRIGDQGLMLNGQQVYPTRARYGMTDITPWRFQAFKAEAGKSYIWSNRKVSTGQVLQSGTITPDNRNLLTVTGFLVDRDPTGNKLTIEPALGKSPPKVDETLKVGELAYDDYIKNCKNPVVLLEVKPPTSTLTISQLIDRPLGSDGCVSYKGGTFDSHWDGALKVAQPGYYVLTAMAKAQYGYSWPQLSLKAGGKGKAENQVVDSPDFAPYKWYAKADAGKMLLRIDMRGDYEYGGEGECPFKGCPQKLITVRDITFDYYPEDKAAETAVEIRPAPRSINLPAGMPVQFTGTVISATGAPMNMPITWKCEGGATIDDKGVFTSTPGTYTLTAESGGASSKFTVHVDAKLVDNFNEGGYLRPGWTTLNLDSGSATWAPDYGGTANLVMTMLRLTNPKGAKSACVWSPGALFTDYTTRGDFVVFTPRNATEISYGKGGKFIHGLVARAKDKDNFYRLEIERRADGSSIRLVKRKGGQDTVLAQSKEPGQLATFNFQSSATTPYYSKIDPESYLAKQLKLNKVDQMTLTVSGKTISAQVNGKDVFAPVEDGDLASGAPGFYGETDGIFDNFEVQSAK